MPKIPCDRRRFFIKQEGGEIQGPFPASKLRRWLDTGKLRPEMSISEDREHWTQCTEAQAVLEPPPADPGLGLHAGSSAASGTEGLLGCGVLALIVVGLFYACSGGDDGGLDTETIPGTYTAHRMAGSLHGADKIVSHLVLQESGTCEWWERNSGVHDAPWKLRVRGEWIQETEQYRNTGGDYQRVRITGALRDWNTGRASRSTVEMVYAFEEGSLNPTPIVQIHTPRGLTGEYELPISAPQKTSDDTSPPQPVK